MPRAHRLSLANPGRQRGATVNRTRTPRETGRLRAVYTCQELADLMGISALRTRRLILRSGIRVERSGKRILVPISAFRIAFPELWESIITVHQMKR